MPRATVAMGRDSRVQHAFDGRTYPDRPAVQTDVRGRATLKAAFPAKGSADGFSVFVLDSALSVDGVGYRSARVGVSPIYRLDFPPKKKRCEVPLPFHCAANDHQIT